MAGLVRYSSLSILHSSGPAARGAAPREHRFVDSFLFSLFSKWPDSSDIRLCLFYTAVAPRRAGQPPASIDLLIHFYSLSFRNGRTRPIFVFVYFTQQWPRGARGGPP